MLPRAARTRPGISVINSDGEKGFCRHYAVRPSDSLYYSSDGACHAALGTNYYNLPEPYFLIKINYFQITPRSHGRGAVALRNKNYNIAHENNK